MYGNPVKTTSYSSTKEKTFTVGTRQYENDESRVTLDGPDSWSKDGFLKTEQLQLPRGNSKMEVES